ncbi:hypothetical protein [Flavobacterium sp.]|uniref:hypothetical protein n=1 Tax=Flavobacterium sp. TaxID=239 RepID=UPI002FDAD6AB
MSKFIKNFNPKTCLLYCFIWLLCGLLAVLGLPMPEVAYLILGSGILVTLYVFKWFHIKN